MPVKNEQHNSFLGLLFTIGISFFVWEGSFTIDRILNARFPWEKKPFKRAISQSLISIVYSILIIYPGTFLYDEFVCAIPEQNRQRMASAGIVLGALATLIIMAVEVGRQFFHKWKQSLLEIEKYKKETVEAQLENLKSQVNPHFLFNNLSVLSSLVYKDQDKAVDFINQFSKVYRYILDNKDKELIELETELKFIDSYCYLLKIRFGDGVNFKTTINSTKKALLPPMALQLLIENTIKHNETSEEKPLHVDIVVEKDHLGISNNLQLRKQSEPSNKLGLHNIRSRYKYFTDQEVKIIHSETTYKVEIPLLTAN